MLGKRIGGVGSRSSSPNVETSPKIPEFPNEELYLRNLVDERESMMMRPDHEYEPINQTSLSLCC